MKHKLLLFSLLACLASVRAMSQTDSQRAQDQLARGIEAFKQYQYESATEHFRLAHQLDPQSRVTAMYLATALSQMYVPGVDTPDNLKWATEAVETYQQVLALEPRNLIALKNIGYLNM